MGLSNVILISFNVFAVFSFIIYLISRSGKKKDLRQGYVNQRYKLHSDILTNISEGVSLTRVSDGIIVFTNSKFDELLGYEKGELIGKHVSLINAPVELSPEEVAEVIIKELSKKGGWWGDIKNLRKDKSFIWCRAGVSTFMHPEYGKVWVSVHTDITERKNFERKLQESEEKFRLFINSSPLGILLTKPTGEILSANPACCKILQMNEGEIIRNGREAVIDRSDPRLKKALEERQERGEVHAKRITMIRKNGEKFEAEVSSVIFHDSEGNEMTSMVLDDVTERKQMEEALQASEERLRNIIEQMQEGVSVTDETGKIIYWNKFTVHTTGLEAKDVIGKYIWDIQYQMAEERVKTPEFYQKLKKGLLNFLETGDAPWANQDLVRKYRHPEGRESFLLGHVTAIPSKRGFMLVATYQDITERKNLEDKMRFLADYDQLTKLPNRHVLNDRLLQAMAANKRSRKYGALLFLDLDNFKPLNDDWGHNAGDILLEKLAQRLRDSVRESDTVARFGGDEFIVMLAELDTDKDKSEEEANHVAAKILNTVQEPFIFNLDGKLIQYGCTVSVGAVLFRGHSLQPEDIISMADKAMYLSKQSGRNRVTFYSRPENE